VVEVVCEKFNHFRDFMVRVKHNSNFIQFITDLAVEKKIKVATFTAVGALKWAKLGFYDQLKHEYQEIKLDSPFEIACCLGNISIKDGKTFVHAHAVLADKKGDTKAGHLLEGKVFAAEVHLRELKGVKLERKYDVITGLSLWEIK
jgi:predicted DNA-binding protein with PD1-like motif